MEREYPLYAGYAVCDRIGIYIYFRWFNRYHPCGFCTGYPGSRYVLRCCPLPHCNGCICDPWYVGGCLSLVPENVPAPHEQEIRLCSLLADIHFSIRCVLPDALLRIGRRSSSLLL